MEANVSGVGTCIFEDQDGSINGLLDFGLNVQMRNDLSFLVYPSNPYATVYVGPTDSSGTGNFTLLIHEGSPGLYGLTLQVDGAETAPAFFYVPSELSAIDIITEPTRQSRQTGTGSPITAAGALQDDGSWLWPVGVVLEQPPVLKLTNASGAPLSGYQVSVLAYDQDTDEFLGNRAAFEVSQSPRTD